MCFAIDTGIGDCTRDSTYWRYKDLQRVDLMVTEACVPLSASVACHLLHHWHRSSGLLLILGQKCQYQTSVLLMTFGVFPLGHVLFLLLITGEVSSLDTVSWGEIENKLFCNYVLFCNMYFWHLVRSHWRSKVHSYLYTFFIETVYWNQCAWLYIVIMLVFMNNFIFNNFSYYG